MDDSASKPQSPQRIIGVNIPLFYANTFNVGLAITDIAITLYANGQPFQILNLSYNTAKGLGQALNTAIERYEKDTGVKILDPTETTKILKKETK